MRFEPKQAEPRPKISLGLHYLETGIALIGGIGVGAVFMYLLDPDRGRRRRAILRDKAVGIGNDAKKVVVREAHDLRNRAVGKLHETRKRVFSSEQEEVPEQASSARAAIL